MQEEWIIGVEIRVPATDPTSGKVHQHAAGAPKKGSRSVGVSRGGRNMVERVFNRMKHCRKAATRYDRLDETFLADLQLILIAIYLKNTAKTQLV